MLIKTSKGKKVNYSLICVFVLLVLFVLFVLLVHAKYKKNKEFKTALITSFMLLLNSSYNKH